MEPTLASRDCCTGCAACAQACPHACITLAEGAGGHRYPVVDADACTGCLRCERACPERHPVGLQRPVAAYAAWHEDVSEYHSSTSGGAATAFGQAILARGGVVYGCAAGEGLTVGHIRVTGAPDLARLKGSKYVQSDVGDTYVQARRDLQAGREVLYVGTPCQIAGLKASLGRAYDNLYTVDIICHGTPSLSCLREHVARVGRGRAVRVEFRRGNDMGLRLYDAAGRQTYYSNVWRERYRDAYYSAFIDGYSYRPACYRCRYARAERCADVTLGDFWGLPDDFPYDRVNGCSCVLPVTGRGERLLGWSRLCLHRRTVDEAVRGNDQLRAPRRLDWRRRLFGRLLPVLGLGAAYRLCEADHIIYNKLRHLIG